MAYGISTFSETAFASLGGGIANANGQNINTNQGSVTVDLNTPVNVTGNALTALQNSVTIRANANANLTGLPMSSSVNSVNTTDWEIIDTGTSVVYTLVAA